MRLERMTRPRRAAGPGPARVLVHPSETWSHPRGTLGRCHKGSEINIAVTDFMLVLGHTWEIKDNTYRIEDAKVFFVEKGTAIEMYQTTLHLSPCRVSDIGFKDVVILPRGTNTPLNNGGTDEAAIGEERLLLQRNKWVIAHPDREPLIKQGAYPGLLGENKELYY